MSFQFPVYLTKTLLIGLSWMPRSFMLGLSVIIKWLLKDLLHYRIETIQNNLDHSFPGLSPEQRAQIMLQYYQHLSELVPETIRWIRRKPAKPDPGIRVLNPDILEEQARRGQHIVILAGHMGNWEYFASILVRYGFNTLAIYKPQSHPFGDRLFYEIREKKGIKLASMKESLRVFSQMLQDNKPVALLLVADQIPAEGDIHFWAPFLHQPTAWFTGGGKIATKFKLPVYYLDVSKMAFEQYRIRILQIENHNPEDPEKGITLNYIRLLEQNIRRQPEIWLWSHRRWKYKPKETVSL
ncbi:MAG: lysophospholipid acyltransferase family protein [Bacteroidales bacterium]|nr:lysophospholipid acyltransferase family protein [Bacteroidales bacterium]